MKEEASISFGRVTRGRGQVFVSVSVTAPDGALASARNGDREGRALPCCLRALGPDEAVAYLPVLECVQTLTVEVRDERGELLASASKRLSPLGARLSSSLNTLRKDERAEAIRNVDQKLGPASLCLQLVAVVEDGDHDVLVGELGYDCFDEATAISPVSVEAFDLSGANVTRVACALSDECDVEGEGGLMRRRQRFSLALTQGVETVAVFARLKEGDRRSDFIVVEPYELGQLREHTRLAQSSVAEVEPAEGPDALTREAELEAQRRSLGEFAQRPTFSIIVPLYKTPRDFLDQMVDSVLAQTYPDLELLLVNASPEDDGLCARVEEIVCSDERVRSVELEDNQGITLNTNAGIRAATGDFLCFLDHDDTIEPDALWWYAREVSLHPETDLLYCDEDHLLDGRLIGPFHKSDWDPILLCAQNYVCHMLCVRRSVVEGLEGLPGREFDGSQDHNMTLLVGERARRVAHVPRVLYHWRMHENSTAGKGVGQKSYALEAERLAVQSHLDRCGVKARADVGGRFEGRCDLRFELPADLSLLVVVQRDKQSSDADALVGQVRRQLELAAVDVDAEVVVLDAGADLVREVARGHAAASHVLVLGPRVTAPPEGEWLPDMIGPLASGMAGCVGARSVFESGLLACAGVLVDGHRRPKRVYPEYPASKMGYYEYNRLPHAASAVGSDCFAVAADDLASHYDATLGDYAVVGLCLSLAEEGRLSMQQNYVSVRVTAGLRTAGASAEESGELACRRELLRRFGFRFVGSDPYYTPDVGEDNLYFGA